MVYRYIKLPFNLGAVWFEWKRNNTPLFEIDWCCKELFICIGVMRIIFTPNIKPKGKDAYSNTTEGDKDKSSSGCVVSINNRRAVS